MLYVAKRKIGERGHVARSVWHVAGKLRQGRQQEGESFAVFARCARRVPGKMPAVASRMLALPDDARSLRAHL